MELSIRTGVHQDDIDDDCVLDLVAPGGNSLHMYHKKKKKTQNNKKIPIEFEWGNGHFVKKKTKNISYSRR